MPDAKWLPLDAGFSAKTWSRRDWMARARAGERVDPRMVWADTTAFVDLGGALPAWVPVAFELKQGKTAAAFALKMKEKEYAEHLRVPDVFSSGRVEGLDDARFCTALVGKEVFQWLDAKVGQLREWVERFELDLPVEQTIDMDASGVDVQKESQPHGRAPRSDAPDGVVGVIDHGIAFAHRRFLVPGEQRTRIQYFWNQDIAPLGKRTAAGPNCMRSLGYGRERTGGDINDAISTHTYAGLVDEDAVYRALAHDGVGRRLAHGTHVMDVACGADDATDPVARVPIVAVQLPWATAQDTSGGALTVHAINGMRYVLDRADAMARRWGTGWLPVVVNMSYGTSSGPHDGSSILEAALDEMVRLRSTVASCAIVVPSGNAHLARCHVKLDIAAGKSVALPAWHLLPDDGTPSFLEIWFPKGTRDIAIEVKPPTGESSGSIGLNEGCVWKTTNGADVLCTATVLERNARGDAPMAFVAVAPTTVIEGRRAVAPSGNWRVTVINRSEDDLAIDAWIQRDDRLPGARLCGRQSRFEDPKYQRFEHPCGRAQQEDNASPVKRAGSMSGMGTGLAQVAVGGYRESDKDPAPYSAGGPTPGRTGPDALAVTEDSEACVGVLAAGSRSGSVVAMRGTSVAAPQATRALILKYLGAQADMQPSAAAAPSAKPRPGYATQARAAIAAIVRDAAAARGAAPGERAPVHVSVPSPFRGGDGRLERLGSRPRRRESQADEESAARSRPINRATPRRFVRR